MRTVRRSIGDRPETVVFFQVPDLPRILRERAFWDIYYEHCSYFAAGSLARLFRHTGFRVLETWTAYNEQYLMIEARPSDAVEPTADETDEDVRALWTEVADFAAHSSAKIATWKKDLAQMKQQSQRVVVWGGGSKGVTFLTTLGVTDEVAYAVDVNPHKHGTFMAGTGHEVVSPQFLKDYRPDVVIVMNPVYTEEISRDLRGLGLNPRLIPVQ
jgi:C-methyltransferase C-terminal domain